MEPREFFIEDWLEKYKTQTSCNLGESGFKNFTISELISILNLNVHDLENIYLGDSPNMGSEDLRYEISKLYNNIPIENILITTGTSEALYILFQILLSKSDKISLFSPAFQALYEIPKMIGAKIRMIDVENYLDIEKLFFEKSKLYILNHPHNPTGISLNKTQKEILEKIEISDEENILFDEHYRFLSYIEELGYTGYKNKKNYFATGSITKCFGVTGLRIGWLIADPNFIKKARSYKDYITHTVNPISEFLALKILKNWKNIITPIKNNILQNINFFEKEFIHLEGIKSFIKPDGGLVSFLELEKHYLSSEYSQILIDECDVFVLPGVQFEKEGYIRIGFGEDCKKFEDGILRWKKRFKK